MFIWIITLLAIAGVALNVKRRIEGFYLWTFSNLGFIWVDYHVGLYAQALLFVIYTGLSLWGIFEWRKKDLSGRPS